MLERVRDWLAAGQKVKIFTARVACFEPYRSEVTKAIHEWLEKHGLPRLDVTNEKDMQMIELWDDRAFQVEKNTGRVAVLPPVVATKTECRHPSYSMSPHTRVVSCDDCGEILNGEKAA